MSIISSIHFSIKNSPLLFLLHASSYFGNMAKSIRFSEIVESYENQSTSDEFYVWLEKLELVAELQGVTDLRKFLPLFLSGPAFAVYQQLSPAVKSDFDSLACKSD